MVQVAPIESTQPDRSVKIEPVQVGGDAVRPSPREEVDAAAAHVIDARPAPGLVRRS